MTVLKAGGLYFLIVFAAGFVLGALRAQVIAPALGPLAAVFVEIPVMLAISWWAAGRATGKNVSSPAAALAVGGLYFVLLQAGEAVLAFGMAGGDPKAMDALYGRIEAQIGLGAQALTALFPLGHVLRNRP
jgi:hypothetical protein